MSTYRRMNLDLFYRNAQNTAPNEVLHVKPEMVEIAWTKKKKKVAIPYKVRVQERTD